MVTKIPTGKNNIQLVLSALKSFISLSLKRKNKPQFYTNRISHLLHLIFFGISSHLFAFNHVWLLSLRRRRLGPCLGRCRFFFRILCVCDVYVEYAPVGFNHYLHPVFVNTKKTTYGQGIRRMTYFQFSYFDTITVLLSFDLDSGRQPSRLFVVNFISRKSFEINILTKLLGYSVYLRNGNRIHVIQFIRLCTVWVE